ncbi:anthranilate synthase component I family protein [Planktosalinus lacus]|uniref:Anthranilate synthase component 1 n=1 Tax=Planktosalinus lacus TaxID=1526573 RepID=A0A8J2Y931_9FLAO|nr:anthranilate synthase component I family protein [Planktosalinus lacus]GGD96917.1 anthranilate synthase component I [Planktosalinus lacus]
MTFTFQTNIKKTLSDTHTPVEVYLKFRDKYPGCFLLESSDYKSKENSFSYICLQSIASFSVERNLTKMVFPNGQKQELKNGETRIAESLNTFAKSFQSEGKDYDFVTSGLFGYTSYDAIPLFEEIDFKNDNFDLPLIEYHLFKYIIVFNHFNNELFLVEQLAQDENSNLSEIEDVLNHRTISQYKFSTVEAETSNFNDSDFVTKIKKGIDHCYKGDVFQVVLSRKYFQKFKGDEFNVYRALRSINPSPYLFYFDFGNFKIFGSSPEAQLTISNQKAIINPIAGTFKRTGNAQEDAELAKALSEDPKENAEHIMLVDLARNDLSKNSNAVTIDSFKQVEYYSHVIHLVSKVSAQLSEDYNPIKILGDTYPAGTLSGAPKHRAMQIIDENEPQSRGFYGGTIGIIGLNGSFNHAIFIRSFLSRKNTLTYQAGCGIVAKSVPESELTEVENKLSALRQSIELAKTL